MWLRIAIRAPNRTDHTMILDADDLENELTTTELRFAVDAKVSAVSGSGRIVLRFRRHPRPGRCPKHGECRLR